MCFKQEIKPELEAVTEINRYNLDVPVLNPNFKTQMEWFTEIVDEEPEPKRIRLDSPVLI